MVGYVTRAFIEFANGARSLDFVVVLVAMGALTLEGHHGKTEDSKMDPKPCERSARKKEYK